MDLIFTLLILTSIGVAVGDGFLAEDTLVLVHAIVRHGDRTPEPLTGFPNDVYRNHTFYPYGVGELNKEGMTHSFRVGKQLRKRYEHFFGPRYYPELVEALSSGYPRCRMTMQILLAAMFPPDGSQTFETGLSWQPIPYKYNEIMEDRLICTFIRCMRILFDVKPQLSKTNLTCENLEHMYRYLTLHIGKTADDLKTILFVQDLLKSEFENGLKLPAWAEAIWPEPLNSCANDFWRYFAGDETLLAKAGGEFIKKIMDDTKEKLKQNDQSRGRKLFLYSVHDFNIYVLLKIINSYNDTALNYGAFLLFEVHKIEGIYGFKVFFENHDGSGPTLLEIPRCGSFCPVEDLYEMTKSLFHPEHC